MSNYPPGTSAGDPKAPWNAPDRSHEHEWRHEESVVVPEIEDGAACFHEECQYAEGRFGDGWQCEETRKYRFEYSTLDTPDGKEIELLPIERWEEMDEAIREKIREIETAFNKHGPGGEVSWDVDPDPGCGVVTIEWGEYALNYRA